MCDILKYCGPKHYDLLLHKSRGIQRYYCQYVQESRASWFFRLDTTPPPSFLVIEGQTITCNKHFNSLKISSGHVYIIKLSSLAHFLFLNSNLQGKFTEFLGK